jgi:hypothetical protein
VENGEFMRQLLLMVAVVLFVVSPATAGQSKPTEEQLLRSGARNITIGTVLVAAGLVAMPITDLNDPHKDTQRAVGAGLTAAGMGFVLWGVHDRYKAVRPQISFGAVVGKSKAVYVRRRW